MDNFELNRETTKFLNKITRESPFFKKFSETKYQSPKGYIEYDIVILQISRVLTSYNFSDGDFFKDDISHRFSLIALNQAYNLGFRPFWLDKSLLSAFLHSKIPNQLAEIKRISPVGLLFFPPILKNPDGQFLKWVLYFHRLSTEPILPIHLSNNILEIDSRPEPSLCWCTLLDDGSQYGINRSLVIQDHQLIESNDTIFISERIQDNGKNIDTKSEEEFSDKVTELLIQIFLYMQLQEKTISYVSSPKTKLHKQSKKQRLSAYIIGENYHIKKEYDAKIPTENRITPITHWRSGHWRYQPFGSRQNPYYKLIWIEPTLINS